MSLEENKNVVRRHFEEIFNSKNFAAIEELTAADYLEHGTAPFQDPAELATSGEADGPESVRAAAEWLLSAFPDLHIAIELMVAEEDFVAVRSMMEGTHQGEFQGLLPTGKRFKGTRMDIFRIRDGKIAEHWTNRDDLGMFLQLGVFQPPG